MILPSHARAADLSIIAAALTALHAQPEGRDLDLVGVAARFLGLGSARL
jgi:hypothetical protein